MKREKEERDREAKKSMVVLNTYEIILLKGKYLFVYRRVIGNVRCVPLVETS